MCLYTYIFCSYSLLLWLIKSRSCQSIPSPGMVSHMTVDEESAAPFSESRIEQVFMTTGEDISSVSVAVYHNRTLAIGSIFSNLAVCEVHHLMF